MYKLLICEDESLERKALNLLIQRHYRNIHLVGYATTGFEAIKLAHQHLPDIILMDIDMPQCNGLDAQKKICRFLPNVNTVIITAYNDFTYAQQAIKCGVIDFLLKPIAPNDLYNCLDKILKSIQKTDSASAVPPEYTDYIQKILDYIDYHFLDDLNLSDLASKFNLNEKYLSRYFKQKMGTSFTEYIIKLKIERSKNMLEYSDAPIYEIAADLNFNDASYFTKVFQKKEGVSPSQYRKNVGKSQPSRL
jgi:YesN/AraC family two-component response regulator